VVGRAEEGAAARQDVVGEVAPVREPGGTLAVERAQAPLAMAAEIDDRHISPQLQTDTDGQFAVGRCNTVT